MLTRPEAETLRLGLEEVRRRLPKGWSLTRVAKRRDRLDGESVDATARLSAPDETTTVLVLQVSADGSPRTIRVALSRLPEASIDATPLLIAPFLPKASRELAEAAAVNYVDLTGNVRLELQRPALFLRETGATKNPWPSEQRRSLGGAAAGRIILRLCEVVLPYSPETLTVIAQGSGVSLSYVSRIIDLLEREDLVRRKPRGPIEEVDRPALVRRWAEDYNLLESNQGRVYLDPRGAAASLNRIATAKFQGGIGGRCAVTGSFVAHHWAPVASPAKLVCFTDDPDRAAGLLGLASAGNAGNVFLLSPYDPIVYETSTPWSHPDWAVAVPCAAPAQVAVDCLTGPDRMPQEGEALLDWLQQAKPSWRGFDHRGRP